jgi:hypothetical protein
MAFSLLGYTFQEVKKMSSVSPAIREKFDSMPPHLQEAVLKLDVKLETMGDLMACLERIIANGEQE